MEKYYINDDTIIFDCEFDEPLDEYIDVIKYYKKLIFSDYHDYKLYIILFLQFNFNIFILNGISNS